jgi:hypothetical protein
VPEEHSHARAHTQNEEPCVVFSAPALFLARRLHSLSRACWTALALQQCVRGCMQHGICLPRPLSPGTTVGLPRRAHACVCDGSSEAFCARRECHASSRDLSVSWPSIVLLRPQVFDLADRIDAINDTYWDVRAEFVPADEEELTDDERLIHVYHFRLEPPSNQVLAAHRRISTGGRSTVQQHTLGPVWHAE